MTPQSNEKNGYECRICSLGAVSMDLLKAVPCETENRTEKVKELIAKESKKIELLQKLREEHLKLIALSNSRLHAATPPSPAASPPPSLPPARTGGLTGREVEINTIYYK